MRQDDLVAFSPRPGAFDLTRARILVDANDYEGIKIVAEILAEDFSRVTRQTPPAVRHYAAAEGTLAAGPPEEAIIIGCFESSPLLQGLEKAGKVSFARIRGKWESFCTAVVDSPVEGCEKALVIAGSDKRGAIYGAYTLSEQMGVSPYVPCFRLSGFRLVCVLTQTRFAVGGIGGQMFLPSTTPRYTPYPPRPSAVSPACGTVGSS